MKCVGYTGEDLGMLVLGLLGFWWQRPGIRLGNQGGLSFGVPRAFFGVFPYGLKVHTIPEGCFGLWDLGRLRSGDSIGEILGVSMHGI